MHIAVKTAILFWIVQFRKPIAGRLAPLICNELYHSINKLLISCYRSEIPAVWAYNPNQRQDAATVDHLAYLAQRRVAIAQETAKRKGAEATVSQPDAERDKIQLSAWTEEADKSQRQAQDSEMRVRQLESQLNELNAKQTDRGLVITLGDVLFDTNRAQLKSGGVREVQKLAEALKQHPQRTVFIERFTDSIGTESRNQELSEQRAIAVRDTLLRMGVASNRITISGYGKSFSVASNDTEAGRQLNRRVEIIISDETGNIRSR